MLQRAFETRKVFHEIRFTSKKKYAIKLYSEKGYRRQILFNVKIKIIVIELIKLYVCGFCIFSLYEIESELTYPHFQNELTNTLLTEVASLISLVVSRRSPRLHITITMVC